MKYFISLLLMALVVANIGCASFHDNQPKALVVGMMDATPNKAKYVAESPDGSVIRVSLAEEPYRESIHGRIRLDGSLPTHALTEFRVSIDGVNMDIPTGQCSQIGDPHIASEYNPLKIEYVGSGLFYVYLSGSDGAGSHERRFVFSKQKWIRTEFRDEATWEYL